MTEDLLLPMLVATVVGLGLPYMLGPVLYRLGVVDIPNSRSSHSVPVVRGTGIAPLSAFVIGLGFVLISRQPWLIENSILLIIILASMGAALLGWIEDFRGLRVTLRAGVQIAIGTMTTITLCTLVGASWGWIAVGAVAVAAYINVANFMDGIDGMSAAHGLLVGCTFAWIGHLLNVNWLTAAGAVLAIAFATFLPWNLVRGRMFLGDIGSYFLGASIAAITIAGTLTQVPAVSLLAPMSIYLADTGATLIRRVWTGEKWYEAHRTHIYQKLTDSGRSHIRVTTMVLGLSCVAAAAGLLALIPTWWGPMTAIGGIVAVISLYLNLPRFVGSKFAEPNRPNGGDEGGAPRSSRRVADRLEAATTASEIQAPVREKWAVVGGTGFIGSALVAHLSAQGIEVSVIRAPRLELAPDLARRQFVADERISNEMALILESVQVVINAAGLGEPDRSADSQLFGANSLLPLVVARAATLARCRRYIHLSSAAVQGRRRVLDESSVVAPFSAYSESKAIGEQALLDYSAPTEGTDSLDVVIVRATSVQGAGRSTTVQLQKLARSPLASVARPGNQPTVVSSLDGLVRFLTHVGKCAGQVPRIVLQPWEGATTREVLLHAGGREPKQLPAWLCSGFVTVGYLVGRVLSPINGLTRRVELMWFGQEQEAAWAERIGFIVNTELPNVLSRGSASLRHSGQADCSQQSGAES